MSLRIARCVACCEYFFYFPVKTTEHRIVSYKSYHVCFSLKFFIFVQLLLVDKKITNARDLVNVLEDAIRGGYPILLVAEDIEQEALATLVVNKLRGALKIAAIKAPGFGERKSQYLDDIAILTGGMHLSWPLFRLSWPLCVA